MTRIIQNTRAAVIRGLRDNACAAGVFTSAEFYYDLADVLEGKAIYRDDPEPTANITNIITAPARNTDPATSHLSAITNFTTGRGKLLKAFGASQFPMSAERACRAAGITGTASPWKRVSELKKAGIIEPTGRRVTSARGAQVEEYRLTTHGKAEYERLVEATDG